MSRGGNARGLTAYEITHSDRRPVRGSGAKSTRINNGYLDRKWVNINEEFHQKSNYRMTKAAGNSIGGRADPAELGSVVTCGWLVAADV